MMCEIIRGRKKKARRMPARSMERAHGQLAAGPVPCCAGQLTVIFFSNKKKMPMRFRSISGFFFFQHSPTLNLLFPPHIHPFHFCPLYRILYINSQAIFLAECIRVERSSTCPFEKDLQLTSTERKISMF